MDHCVIRADFADFRRIKGRKVLQLFMEVSLDEAEHVLNVLGHPIVGESKWCAVALLDETKLVRDTVPNQSVITNGEREGSDSASTSLQAEGGPPKKSWSEIPRSQQAAILCSDPEFRRYFKTGTLDHTVSRLKDHLRISSRRELDTDQEAGARWDEFYALYQLHRQRLP